jgi:hypothetical protein
VGFWGEKKSEIMGVPPQIAKKLLKVLFGCGEQVEVVESYLWGALAGLKNTLSPINPTLPTISLPPTFPTGKYSPRFPSQ